MSSRERCLSQNEYRADHVWQIVLGVTLRCENFRPDKKYLQKFRGEKARAGKGLEAQPHIHFKPFCPIQPHFFHSSLVPHGILRETELDADYNLDSKIQRVLKRPTNALFDRLRGSVLVYHRAIA